MPAEQFAGIYQAELWPENWQAWQLFQAVATQWRCGPSGVIGLDYGALDREMQLQDIPEEEQLQLRQDIRLLEAAALEAIYEEEG